MKTAKKVFKWMGRKYTTSIAPACADYYYAVTHHGGVCNCLPSSRKRKEQDEEDLDDNEAALDGQSLEYQTKIPQKWTQKDVVSFVCQEVTMGDVKEFRICRLCMENEVDGTALLAAADEDLLELGFDPVSVRKLRGKLDSIGHDNSAELRVGMLEHFLRSNGLGHLRDRLLKELGVFDRDELPALISDKKWVKSIGLTLQDEIKLKSAIRQYAQEQVTSETARQLGSVGNLDGKQKSISIRKKDSASESMNARQGVYDVVRRSGLDKVNFRRKGRPEWLMDVKADAKMAGRRRRLEVPAPTKWNSDTVFTPMKLVAPAVTGRKAMQQQAKEPPGLAEAEAARAEVQAAAASRVPGGQQENGARTAHSSRKTMTSSLKSYDMSMGAPPKNASRGLPPGYRVDEALKTLAPRHAAASATRR